MGPILEAVVASAVLRWTRRCLKALAIAFALSVVLVVVLVAAHWRADHTRELPPAASPSSERSAPLEP
jgi:hypothetical protein